MHGERVDSTSKPAALPPHEARGGRDPLLYLCTHGLVYST